MQGSPAETGTPEHRNLTSRSMTAPPPVSLPSSTPPPPSPHFGFISARKNSARFKKSYYFSSFTSLKKNYAEPNFSNLKLPNRYSACTCVGPLDGREIDFFFLSCVNGMINLLTRINIMMYLRLSAGCLV